jgi:hypothetical protein
MVQSPSLLHMSQSMHLSRHYPRTVWQRLTTHNTQKSSVIFIPNPLEPERTENLSQLNVLG